MDVNNLIPIALFTTFVIWRTISAVKHTRKRKNEIKQRANLEYNNDITISAEELERRLSESELMYQDLEETYWIQSSLLIGLCTYLYWGIWYISLIVCMAIAFIGFKFLSLKPFSTSLPDWNEKE